MNKKNKVDGQNLDVPRECEPTQTELGLRFAITRQLVEEPLLLTIWFNYT
jgi:hypothetical protein